MPTFWDVSYGRNTARVSAVFLGRPKSITEEASGKIIGYEGVSPFGDPKRFIASIPGYPSFSLKRVQGTPPLFKKGQRLFPKSNPGAPCEVSDITRQGREWRYYVTPVEPRGAAGSWIPEGDLQSS